MGKVAIVIDTNVAHNPEKSCNFDELYIFGYDNTVEFIERHDLTESVEVFIPELVLKEVVEHRKRKLKSELSHFTNLCDNFSGSNIFAIAEIPDKNFNCAEYIDRLKERKLKQNVHIVPIPLDKALLFDNILEMGIEKHPPFQKGNSDNGFKDAIILLSIFDFFKDKKEYSEIFLFSKDHGYIGVTRDLIKKRYKINLEIIQGDDIQGFLANKYKLKIEFKKFLLEFIPKIQKIITDKILASDKISLYRANGYQVSNVLYGDYLINEISESEYEVFCPVSIKVSKNELEVSDMKLDVTFIFIKDVTTGKWKIKSAK